MMRSWAVCAAALFLLSLLTLVFFACGGPVFTTAPEQEQDGGPTDATSTPVPSTDAATVDSSPDAGPPSIDASMGAIVYVSASAGRDLNDGLSPSTPKKSLVAGIATAAALGAGTEVHACAGTYVETNLLLTAPVSLRGAYDCSAWTRTATFGYPTFDGANVTLVQNGNTAAQPHTLVVGGNVPSNSMIDGLVIAGAGAFNGTSTGLTIRDNATPLVADDIITGGAGHPALTGDGSIGLSILGAAAPEVRGCAINGGTGTGVVGSIGVQINSSGTPYVHGNVISGGLGTTTQVAAAWGMNILSSAVSPNAISNNIVRACDAPGVIASTAGIRIDAPDAAVDIVGSQIDGCEGTGDGGTNAGIQVSSPGATVQILQDRVYGGTRGGEGALVVGVLVQAAGTLAVHDSMIHAGDVSGRSASTAGISIGPVANSSIAFDTVYGGANGWALELTNGESRARITDSILLGGGPPASTVVYPAIFAINCASAVASLDHTLFANFGGSLYTCDQTAGAPQLSASTIVRLETILTPSVASSDLVYAEQSVCADDAGCVISSVCPGTPTACLGSLFGASWTSDNGVTGLFQSTGADGGTLAGGWTFSPGIPCAIAEGGTPITGIPTDLYDVTRSSATPSLGAAELKGACAP